MATRSTLGYIDSKGEFRGTYINFDGMDLERNAAERFETEGYPALVQWIDAGIAGGGYSSVDDTEPYGEGMTSPVTASEYFGSRMLEFAVVIWDHGARSLEEHLFMKLKADRAFAACYNEAARGVDYRTPAVMYARTRELAKVLYADEPELRDAVVAEVNRRMG
ncbi:hypothetical protein [Citricoccus nitrophenolicus]|uniref:hypothetical protein n=1 Tax=Citricoccus nitrophenolicus TaxID=863575 RepID=UPI0031E8E99D